MKLHYNIVINETRYTGLKCILILVVRSLHRVPQCRYVDPYFFFVSVSRIGKKKT